VEKPKHHGYSSATNTEQLLQQHATTNTTVKIETLDGATETPWT
jgi:hypothetical protein